VADLNSNQVRRNAREPMGEGQSGQDVSSADHSDTACIPDPDGNGIQIGQPG
jgi:hypothetical protein